MWDYNGITEVTDGRVVRAGVSVTWTVLTWSGGHEFEPRSGWTWYAWYFCPKSYLNQNYSYCCHWNSITRNVLDVISHAYALVIIQDATPFTEKTPNEEKTHIGLTATHPSRQDTLYDQQCTQYIINYNALTLWGPTHRKWIIWFTMQPPMWRFGQA